MDVVEILSAPLPRRTRHLPVDAYLLPALHGATWARSATTKKTSRTTGSTTPPEKIRPRIVRAVGPASAYGLDSLASRCRPQPMHRHIEPSDLLDNLGRQLNDVVILNE